MLGDVNRKRKTAYEKLELILCKPDGQELCVLNEAYDIEISRHFQDIDELQFKIPYYIEQHYKQTKNINWNIIKGNYLIKVNEKQLFIIEQVVDDGIDKDIKNVFCYSLEMQLGERKLRLFRGTKQLYLDDIDGAGVSIHYSFDGVDWFTYSTPFVIEKGKVVYVQVKNLKGQIISDFEWDSGKLPEPETPGVAITTVNIDNDQALVSMRLVAETGIGILNILEKDTSWKIGYIDPDVREDRSLGQNHRKYRTFDIVDKPWLAVLKEDVQNAFECVLLFDTINKVIDIYHVDNIGENKGLFISDENYGKTLQKITKYEDIVTRLYVYGRDNLSIIEANPTGLPYIEDFSFFRNLDYMPQDLLDALDRYDNLLEQNTTTFSNYLSELSGLRKENVRLNNELIDLWMDWQIAQDNIDVAIQTSVPDGDEIDLDPVDLTELNAIRDNIQTQIEDKKVQIEQNENQITNKLQQINELRELLSKENNFTERQLEILDSFVYEEVWSNDNIYDVVELYNNGWATLAKMNEPVIEFEMSLVDFLNVVECQHDWDKLVLGDFVNIYYEKFNIDTQVRLVSIVHNVDNNNLMLHFSNKEKKDSPENNIAKAINDAKSTTNMVDIFKHQWDLSLSNQDLVSRIMNDVLDTTRNRLVSGRNQNISIDERGIWLQDMEDDKEQLRMLNNVLAMTTDGWKTVSLAITPKGVVAENIFGKIVASNKLLITNINDSGESTFTVDKNHMTAFNMDLSLENYINRIFLNPTEGIKIQRKRGSSWIDTLWLDTEGVVNAEEFRVINTNSVLDDEGLRIDNGRIVVNNNLGQDVFYADQNGVLNLIGRLRVMTDDMKTTLVDVFKDDAIGGKIQINDWNGNLNLRMGSQDALTNTRGYLKLFDGTSDDVGDHKILLAASGADGDNHGYIELRGATGTGLKIFGQTNYDNIFEMNPTDPTGGKIEFYDKNGERQYAMGVNTYGQLSLYQYGGIGNPNGSGGLQNILQFDPVHNTNIFCHINGAEVALRPSHARLIYDRNLGANARDNPIIEVGSTIDTDRLPNNETAYEGDLYAILSATRNDYFVAQRNRGVSMVSEGYKALIKAKEIKIQVNDSNYIIVNSNGVTVKGSQINLN